VDHSTYADIELKIVWTSDQARHTERHYYQNINFWRDFFPGLLGDRLMNAADGEWVTERLPANDIVPAYEQSNIATLNLNTISPIGRAKIRVTPQQGRFFPRRIIAGHAGVTAEEFLPLRVTNVNDEQFTVDLNHPLARHDLEVSLRVVGERYQGKEERGGRCNDVVYDALMGGIGIEAPLADGTDFYAEGAFNRVDESDDDVFYQQDRLINHIDSTASAQIASSYSHYLRPGMKILDLMSSWQSHLPTDIDDLDITGLGMNANEMTQNPQLSRHVIHDLNQQTSLPFEDNQFDVTVCSLSIEYLVDPLKVMQEIIRVTRPGGRVMVSFSDRWFPPKAIIIWQELHPFERLGMALDYFIKTDGLENIETESIQGLLRPEDDKYADKLLNSDPVFVVSASVASE
jgi:FKBP-type peptidyl-prolyl cis-trans isomerase 2